jgi:hypothetical protein
MPLIKTITDRFGRVNPDTYFLLTGFRIDVPGQIAVATFSGYVSEAAAAAGAEPLVVREVAVIGSEFLEVMVAEVDFVAALNDACYKFAMLDEYFAD